MKEVNKGGTPQTKKSTSQRNQNIFQRAPPHTQDWVNWIFVADWAIRKAPLFVSLDFKWTFQQLEFCNSFLNKLLCRLKDGLYCIDQMIYLSCNCNPLHPMPFNAFNRPHQTNKKKAFIPIFNISKRPPAMQDYFTIMIS